ncbi:MAG: hypothetical protein GYA36_22770 [Veillonellaceae bacterium]|nr:hypothetical protein [Veillonellaceae bacterium]
MQTVSTAWVNNQKRTILEESFVELFYDITDPEAIAEASVSDNGTCYISNTQQITNNIIKTFTPYATLERNVWVLDGSRKNIPENNYKAGYVSKYICSESSSFEQIPVIEISFAQTHTQSIPGITIIWAEEYNEYATDFKVVAYNDNEIIAEKRIIDNASTTSIVEMNIDNYNRICIEILKWCLPYHRARITDVFVGVRKTYDKSQLVSFEYNQYVDPLSANLPKTSINVEIDNTSDIYNPFYNEGMSKYLTPRQQIRARYGYKVDEEIEWINGGTFYLSEWEIPQNSRTAKIEARDLLEFMNATYMKGLYSSTGIDLYTLAQSVLQEANLPLNKDGSVKWTIDESLKNIYTNAALPLTTLSQCLQMIANASQCVLYVDRDDILHIEPIGNIIKDYTIDKFNSYKKAEISLTKALERVDVTIYNNTPRETAVAIYNGTMNINGTSSTWIKYTDPAIDVAATVTNGTLISAQYYTNACLLTISGNGAVEITITGRPLETSETIYTLSTGLTNGETQKVLNPLITTSERAANVADWVKNYLSNRKILSAEWRADPRLDALDIINIQNDYGTYPMRTTSVTFTFKGAFRGESEGRLLNDMA